MSSVTQRCGAILVVDDDAGSRELVTGLLREAGYTAKPFASARDGLAYAEQERPALAILDVCMPEISGHDACRRLRDLYGETVSVLFISGERVEAVDRAAGLLLGGDDYLVKPFASEELLARVGSLLRRVSPSAGDGDQQPLTARETAVLLLLAEGMSRHEIARELVISPKTVSAHLSRIYDKLGARDRVQALRVAYRTRILQPL